MDKSFSPHKSFLPRSAFQEHPLQAAGELCSSSGVSKKILIEGGSSQGAWLFIEHTALHGASSEQGLRGTFGWLRRRNRRAFCRSRWSCHAWEPAQPCCGDRLSHATSPEDAALRPPCRNWGRHRGAEHRHNSSHHHQTPYQATLTSIQPTPLVSSYIQPAGWGGGCLSSH